MGLEMSNRKRRWNTNKPQTILSSCSSWSDTLCTESFYRCKFGTVRLLLNYGLKSKQSNRGRKQKHWRARLWATVMNVHGLRFIENKSISVLHKYRRAQRIQWNVLVVVFLEKHGNSEIPIELTTGVPLSQCKPQPSTTRNIIVTRHHHKPQCIRYIEWRQRPSK